MKKFKLVLSADYQMSKLISFWGHHSLVVHTCIIIFVAMNDSSRVFNYIYESVGP